MGGRSKLVNEKGKTYVCGVCGTEVIVTRGGQGTLVCCGKEMTIASTVC
jgi:desulfoferrodoxin-like iron-binding protein